MLRQLLIIIIIHQQITKSLNQQINISSYL